MITTVGIDLAKKVFSLHGIDGAGEVLRIELTGPDFRVELGRWRKRMVTTVNGLSQCVSLPESSSYLLMREELGIAGRDEVFEQTLETALRAASQ